MISLPLSLTPSELLCCEELPPFIARLVQSVRSFRVEGRLSEAERCALDALEGSQEPGTNVSRAVALIHLGDVHRDMDKLGPALTDYRGAYRIFQRQSSSYQRHNEAVAAYALGLVHQLLGDNMDALNWYQQSVELFDRVKEHWAAVNALAQVKTCTLLQRWMETLREYLTAARTRVDAGASGHIRVPVIPSRDDEDGFAMAELEIDEFMVGRQLTVDGDSFRVQPLKGTQRISLTPDAQCYALEVPHEAREALGAHEGDYALIIRGDAADREGPGVLETLGGLEFGNFERDDESKIKFIGLKTALVIGEDEIGEGFQVGYIVGLLKRASPRAGPSTPSSSRPPTPSPPDDATQLS